MQIDLFPYMTARARPRALRLESLLEACLEGGRTRRQRRQLHGLSDRLLKDIGLTRADLLDFGR